MKFSEIFASLDLNQNFELTNRFQLPSYYPVSSLAASSIAAVGCAISELTSTGMSTPSVKVDQTLSSFWFAQSIRPIQWRMPPVWDAVAGDYRTRDGWIKLHTNLAHHKAAAMSVLACEAARESGIAMILKVKSLMPEVLPQRCVPERSG